MMGYTLSIIVILLCGSTVDALIKVDVYYETLCGDSIRFIKNQLIPAYNNLHQYLDINFVPYGKAKYIEVQPQQWTLDCQHGPVEYEGNKAHACVLDQIDRLAIPKANKQFLKVKFVDCALGSKNPAAAARQCAANLGLNSIDNCCTSSYGDDLLAHCGYITECLEPPLSFVPTIVINDVYSDANQEMALVNFVELIRNYISATRWQRFVSTGVLGGPDSGSIAYSFK
ncbi:GILT-like protein 1 [Diachasmimorpha longicaudata]|uniref:GILT-like protein 1 n=1 Tax=Diachasmimorpha longicaudata TaxID=58733 RepID=UPI0030B9136A